MSIAILSVLVTGGVSLLGVRLSFYSIRTQRNLALFGHATSEARSAADRLRGIVSEHISLANTVYLAGATLGEPEERELIRKMTALEAETAILLATDGEDAQAIATKLAELRRTAIREQDVATSSGKMDDGFVKLRDEIVQRAGSAIHARSIVGLSGKFAFGMPMQK